MLEQLYPWFHLVGRILFSFLFIASGMNHFLKFKDMSGYAKMRGIPAPGVSTIVIGVFIVVGGVTILLGWRRFVGAGLIAISMVLTATLMHPFWKENDPMAKMNEMIHFMKDLALCGAALLIAYYAGLPWPMSLGG